MRSDKQIEASRRNGAKSKGPVTEEGKAISSLNGTSHGLSGGHRFLYCNEQDELYQELLSHYMSVFAPANGVEDDLVRQIVAASWRMKRIDRIEAATVDVQMVRQQSWVDKEYKGIEDDTRQAIAFQTHTVGDTVALVGRYHARALRSYNSGYKILRELQRNRPKSQPQETQNSQAHKPQNSLGDIPAHHPSDPKHEAVGLSPLEASSIPTPHKPQNSLGDIPAHHYSDPKHEAVGLSPLDKSPIHQPDARSYKPNPRIPISTDCNQLETQLT